MTRVLVLRGGALGDFIVTLPALALLRARWPQARIELAGNATAARLALARGLVDGVHSQHEARWAELYGDAPLTSSFAEWLEGFDLVLSYWPDPEGELQRRFPRHARQRFLAAAAMPARAPAAAHYCEPLRAAGMVADTYCFRLAALPDSVSGEGPEAPPGTSSEPANDIIAVHPGSGSPRKNWPADHWRRLIEHLPPPVSVILGEAEADRWESYPLFNDARTGRERGGSEPPGRASPLPVVNRPLEELVRHFARCRLFIGHDTGISHLAAACGVRCLLLFGPTDPEMWAPPAPWVRVIRHSDLARLPVDDVRRAVEAALEDRR